MEFLDYNVKCEELYELSVSNSTINKIVDLLSSERCIEKKVYDIPTKFMIVSADCQGDAMGNGNVGFVMGNVDGIIFIDPCSPINKNLIISHEFIHCIQKHIYFSEDLTDYDDWTEIMARDYEKRVKELLFVSSTKLRRISNNPEYVESFVEKYIKDNTEVNSREVENFVNGTDRVNPVDDYFDKRLGQHLGMEDWG